MALALDAPFTAQAESHSTIRAGSLAMPALASLGAGAIHAAAIGAHGEHRQAVVLFSIVAAFQLGWGALALSSSRRWLGVVGAIGSAALVGGWVLAKMSGLSFIDGLEAKEPVQWADGMAAGLAAAVVITVALVALRHWRLPAADALVRVFALPVAVLSLTGMIAAGGHNHAGHVHTDLAGNVVAPAAVVPPHPFVPGQPIDLGGVDGVTPAQQARAENLLAATLYKLPQFADPNVATSLGWHSIGDGVTGDEHFVNAATFNDGKLLDPDAPESLVYEMRNGVKTLVAAMYMMPPGSMLAQVPDVGGKLTQWHVHNNLCFTPAGKIAALTGAGGTCPTGLVQGGNTPMIHVWIVAHPCGPFAALEGIGGGTIAAGETRLCDHVHGATTP